MNGLQQSALVLGSSVTSLGFLQRDVSLQSCWARLSQHMVQPTYLPPCNDHRVFTKEEVFDVI